MAGRSKLLPQRAVLAGRGRESVDFEYSARVKEYQARLNDFMGRVVYPNERVYQQQLNEGSTRWHIPPIMEEMKAQARDAGLWNLFLPESDRGAGLTNTEYAPLCE